MSLSPAWQAARAARKARRAADPAVQRRAAEHARREAEQRRGSGDAA